MVDQDRPAQEAFLPVVVERIYEHDQPTAFLAVTGAQLSENRQMKKQQRTGDDVVSTGRRV